MSMEPPASWVLCFTETKTLDDDIRAPCLPTTVDLLAACVLPSSLSLLSFQPLVGSSSDHGQPPHAHPPQIMYRSTPFMGSSLNTHSIQQTVPLQAPSTTLASVFSFQDEQSYSEGAKSLGSSNRHSSCFDTAEIKGLKPIRPGKIAVKTQHSVARRRKTKKSHGQNGSEFTERPAAQVQLEESSKTKASTSVAASDKSAAGMNFCWL